MARPYTKLAQFPEKVQKRATTEIRSKFGNRSYYALLKYIEKPLPVIPNKRKNIKRNLHVKGMWFGRSVNYQQFQKEVNVAFTQLKQEGCKKICAYACHDGLEITGHRIEYVEEFAKRRDEAIFRRAMRLAAREYQKEKKAKDEKYEQAKMQQRKEEQFKELAQVFGRKKAEKLLQSALDSKVKSK